MCGFAPDEGEGLDAQDARHKQVNEEERDFSASRSVFVKNSKQAGVGLDRMLHAEESRNEELKKQEIVSALR